jgi:hypothetical protein
VHRDLGTGDERVADSLQHEHITPLDAIVVACIRELDGQHAEIGKVLPVDAGEGHREYRAQPEEARGNRRMLAGGTLTVIGAGHHNVARSIAGFDGTRGVGLVHLVEGEFSQLGDIASIGQNPRAGRVEPGNEEMFSPFTSSTAAASAGGNGPSSIARFTLDVAGSASAG